MLSMSPGSSTTVCWQSDPLLAHPHLCAMKTEKPMWTWLAPNYSAVPDAFKSSFKCDSSQIYTNTQLTKPCFILTDTNSYASPGALASLGYVMYYIKRPQRALLLPLPCETTSRLLSMNHEAGPHQVSNLLMP